MSPAPGTSVEGLRLQSERPGAYRLPLLKAASMCGARTRPGRGPFVGIGCPEQVQDERCNASLSVVASSWASRMDISLLASAKAQGAPWQMAGFGRRCGVSAEAASLHLADSGTRGCIARAGAETEGAPERGSRNMESMAMPYSSIWPRCGEARSVSVRATRKRFSAATYLPRHLQDDAQCLLRSCHETGPPLLRPMTTLAVATCTNRFLRNSGRMPAL